MDELQTVRELFEEPPAPDAGVVARSRLLATGSRRRKSRLRWAVPGLGLAAATAVAVAVAVPRTSPGPPVAGPADSPARTVLLNAALQADHQPTKVGKYWHVETRARWFQKVKPGGYMIVETARFSTW
ncbi:hypothetical protein GCM10023194_46800 [Planotetraspora phitsanulokensis]|uniref:Uncharacterized protein n=1 Tax=Planotetraspora phitsanulokensis TaxID=575192 RepID=A0A8J3UED6_9ACTN|nr:hypothetical protein Pph01_82280 [Planotetraspora phitsanulokensis]